MKMLAAAVVRKYVEHVRLQKISVEQSSVCKTPRISPLSYQLS